MAAINKLGAGEGGLGKLKSLLDIASTVTGFSGGSKDASPVQELVENKTGYASPEQMLGALTNPMGGVGPMARRIQKNFV